MFDFLKPLFVGLAALGGILVAFLLISGAIGSTAAGILFIAIVIAYLIGDMIRIG